MKIPESQWQRIDNDKISYDSYQGRFSIVIGVLQIKFNIVPLEVTQYDFTIGFGVID